MCCGCVGIQRVVACCLHQSGYVGGGVWDCTEFGALEVVMELITVTMKYLEGEIEKGERGRKREEDKEGLK